MAKENIHQYFQEILSGQNSSDNADHDSHNEASIWVFKEDP